MAEIGSNTRSSHNVVARELVHFWRELEQEGQRLADATVGSEDSDLHFGGGACVKRAGSCGGGG